MPGNKYWQPEQAGTNILWGTAAFCHIKPYRKKAEKYSDCSILDIKHKPERMNRKRYTYFCKIINWRPFPQNYNGEYRKYPIN